MRLLVGALLAFALSCGAVLAQTQSLVAPIAAVPLGYSQITSLTAATTFTLPAGATWCMFVAEGQTVRWRDDGTAPTASIGMPLTINAPLNYKIIPPLTAIQFIQTTPSATLNVSCYR